MHERGGAPLVAGREGDGGLGDEAHGEDHRALDRQHRWVVGGEDGRGAIGVAEPGQLGGQLQLGTGGVEAVACLQVAVPQDRQVDTDLVDVAEQPGGAQSRPLEVQGHPTTGLISDRVEREQRSFEVPVAPVRNAAEPAQDGLPRLELRAFDGGEGREHPRGIASQVRDSGNADGVDEAGDRRARGRQHDDSPRRASNEATSFSPEHQTVRVDGRDLALEVVEGAEPGGGRLEHDDRLRGSHRLEIETLGQPRGGSRRSR